MTFLTEGKLNTGEKEGSPLASVTIVYSHLVCQVGMQGNTPGKGRRAGMEMNPTKPQVLTLKLGAARRAFGSKEKPKMLLRGGGVDEIYLRDKKHLQNFNRNTM